PADGLDGEEARTDEPKALEKDEPTAKVKVTRPKNYAKVGLRADQKQSIYKIQAKYDEEIEKLGAKIKELRATRDKEVKAVLTPDQKKRLEEILIGKDK